MTRNPFTPNINQLNPQLQQSKSNIQPNLSFRARLPYTDLSIIDQVAEQHASSIMHALSLVIRDYAQRHHIAPRDFNPNEPFPTKPSDITNRHIRTRSATIKINLPPDMRSALERLATINETSPNQLILDFIADATHWAEHPDQH